jgi:hypothetical protein
MARYALVWGRTVVNIAEWEGDTEWSPENIDTVIPIPEDKYVAVGYQVDGKDFVNEFSEELQAPDYYSWDGVAWVPVVEYKPYPELLLNIPNPGYEIQ